MSAEERIVKIENLLGTLTEYHVRYAVRMDEMAESRRTHEKEMADIRHTQEQFQKMVFTAGARIFTLIRKNQGQIRELQEGQRELQEGLHELRAHHRDTQERFDILVQTVDRIIRDRNA